MNIAANSHSPTDESIFKFYAFFLQRPNEQASLLYAEAVEIGKPINVSLDKRTFPLDVKGAQLFVYTDSLTSRDVVKFPGNIASLTGQEYSKLDFQAHAPVIVGTTSSPRWSGEFSRPDNIYTYRMKEWWSSSDSLSRLLEKSAELQDACRLITQEYFLELRSPREILGNIRVFRRISQTRIDILLERSNRRASVRVVNPPRGTWSIRSSATSTTGITEVLMRKEETYFSLQIENAEFTILTAEVFDSEGEVVAISTETGNGEIRFDTYFTSTEEVTDSNGLPHTVNRTPPKSAVPTPISKTHPWKDRIISREKRRRKADDYKKVTVVGDGHESALQHLRGIVSRESSISIIDPYFAPKDFLDVLQWAPTSAQVRILCGRPLEKNILSELRDALEKFRLRNPSSDLKFRVTRDNHRPIYHDRLIICSDSAWILGHSLQTIGKKLGFIVQVLDNLELQEIFDNAWDNCPAYATESIL